LRNLGIGIVLLLALAPVCFAQADRPLEWLQQLNASSSSGDESVAAVRRIRQQVRDWIAVHPGSSVSMPEAPAPPWTEVETKTQIEELKRAIVTLLQSDPSHPFQLGLTVVNVTDSAIALSPVFDSMDQTEIRNHDARTASEAIEYLPGVSIDHKSPRNQTGISIGGFDGRQVPLFVDSIPAYVPFDGYVDLNRYLTSDVAEIQVAKGYSSPLLGPNAMGGAINLVTRQPEKRVDADAHLGTGPGSLWNSGLHLGSRWRRLFFQGSIDWLQSDFYPLADGFRLNPQQPSDHRVNSYRRDEQYRGRVGWTRGEQDSYVLSYSNQKGKTGIPPYSGSAPVCPTGNTALTFACVTPKYWSWPEWNTGSYYFNSTTGLGEASSVRLRAFYESFPSVLDMYDDATYTTMTKASSGILNYDDHSMGASGEFATRLLARNTLGASFFVNSATHQEQTTSFSAANAPVTTPQQTDRDLQTSFGVQDAIAVTARLHATLGFSADHLDGREAQDLNSAKTAVAPFQVQGVCTAASATTFTSCTDHVWTYNPTGALSYSIANSGTFFVTFAEKSRFPTLRDRYSYKAGRALPDPALRPEQTQNWTAGYSRTLGLRTVAQIDFFHAKVHNEIENISFLSPLCPSGKGGAGTCQQAVNAGREIHEGANLTLRTTPVSRVTIDANYTFVARRITDPPGLFPTGMPKHKTVGTATVRLPRGTMGLVSARYQSGAVGMSDNNLPLPVAKFATLDIGASVPIHAGMSLQAGVSNLLDRSYYYWEGFPEAGRNWYLTFRYKF
jgi:iron complex outermembrane receptor protein